LIRVPHFVESAQAKSRDSRPEGGVQINGVVYVASGERPHPAFVFFHGLPGNEKNLDLAQAVRRAGWTVIKTSSPLVVQLLPRGMSSPITAGPTTESLSSRWLLIGWERYSVLADCEEYGKFALVRCDPKAAGHDRRLRVIITN